jgi:hypothetical protein
LISEQRDVMFSAAATAVGINMTFLLPYSMLARGWDKHFRGLAIFDLSTGMFIPFVLATSCVIIASANQFHAQPPDDFDAANPAYQKLLEQRTSRLPTPEMDDGERRLAAMLLRRDAKDLAKALEPLTGSTVANVIFGIGVVGMTLSTISLLMLVSGFAICEILNVPAQGWPLRVGCMCAASGVLWPLLWGGGSRTWLAIVASVFGGALLPIAYCTFFLLMNQRSLLGAEMPRGARRLLWNVLMGVAATVATLTSIYFIWQKSKGTGSPWYGMGAVIALLAAILVAQVVKTKK